jgi:hypothetical protein
MDELTTDAKCRAIFEKIVESVNKGDTIAFEEDGGDNTLTVWCNSEHTHVGVMGESFETLVDNLYDLLVKNRGLSWVGCEEVHV